MSWFINLAIFCVYRQQTLWDFIDFTLNNCFCHTVVEPSPSLRCRWRKETEVYLNNSATKSESPEIWARSLRSFTLFTPMEERPSSQRSVLYLREAGRHKGERWIDKCFWYYQNGPHFERFGDLLDFFSQTVKEWGLCERTVKIDNTVAVPSSRFPNDIHTSLHTQ